MNGSERASYYQRLIGPVILEEQSVLLQETHITMHFLGEVAHETSKKVFLPLKTLEFSKVFRGR